MARDREEVAIGRGVVLVAAAAVAIFVVLMGGCGGDSSKSSSKSSTSSVPRSYESSEGKVQFSEGGDTVKIETPEGTSLLINGKLPDDFPKGFPILKDAVIQASSVQPKSGATLRTTRYYTKLAAPEAYDQYMQLLAKAGYVTGETTRQDEGPSGFEGSIKFQGEGARSNQSGIISVSIQYEKVQVSVSLTTSK